ncbi:MAG: OmpP1/FadL family transporter [Janthinobacterium lividum]
MPHWRPFRPTLLASAAVLLGAVATSGPAHAAAFQLKENSAVGLGEAFAGAGSAANTPATAFNNPAGMTQLPGVQIALGGSLIAPQASFSGTARDAFGRPISGSGQNDGANLAAVPHGYITWKPAGSDFAFGLAVTSPFGLATSYGSNFVGRYQADETDLRTIDINPNVAYQVAPWLSLGAGFSAQYGRAVFSQYLNSSTIATSLFRRPTTLPDGFSNLNGNDWAFGYNFGALIQPGPHTNIGITYRSRVEHEFDGGVNYSVPSPLNLAPNFQPSAARAKLVLPDTVGLSITQGIGPNLQVSADVTWTNWSQFKMLNAFRTSGVPIASTPQHYDNSVFASLGAAYTLTEKLTVRAGTAFDKSPVSNAYRTARVPDDDRYWLAVGASYKVLPNVTVDGGYAHVFVHSPRIADVSPTGDVLTGKYSSAIDIFSLGTRTVF